MIGAIIGDMAGSIYEYEQFEKVRPIRIRKIIKKNSFFSDDTILTIAVADAIMSGCNYEEKLRLYAKKYSKCLPKGIKTFPTVFSKNFLKWVEGEVEGKSTGNGAMMRISPVGYLFNTEKEVLKNAKAAVTPSHNSDDAIKCAQTIAMIIYYFRNGLTKEEIINKLGLKIKKPVIEKFNYTCAETIDVVLYCIFNSSSFEDAIKKAISFGGDTDTNACIVGGVAEAMFGVDQKLKNECLKKLPEEFKEVLKRAYKKVQ